MRWRRGRLRAALVLALAAAVAVPAALTGCSRAAGDAGPQFVTPPLIRYTSVLWPVPLELVGAEPGARLRLVARMTNERGTWRSEATYTVPATGILDLATARPQLAGYQQPDSVGLFWSLRGPQLQGEPLARQWMQETSYVSVTALEGSRPIASRTFGLEGLAATSAPRTVFGHDLAAAESVAGGGTGGRLAPPPPETHEDVPVGRFYSARSIERPRTPAVIVFDDGSPGASGDFVAPLLTQFGASVFVVPVGAQSDGIHVVTPIDSSAVTAILDWLTQRGDVDGRAIFAYGTGASEQLALWMATRYPGRVAGVFAAGGATTLLCRTRAAVAPVFEDGVSLPCHVHVDRVDEGVVVPLASIRGPVVLGCSRLDRRLPSACGWLDTAAARRGTRAGDVYLREATAAPAITVPPGLPIAIPDGPSGQATEQARVAFWNAVGTILIRAAQI
ncbi:MAG TPA: acyl-CoA thioesterase/BAAT N-terminal domain-containing protein [Leifsonia sp.]